MNYMNKEFKRQLPASSVYKGSAQTHRQETNKGVAAAICRIPHSRSFRNSTQAIVVIMATWWRRIFWDRLIKALSSASLFLTLSVRSTVLAASFSTCRMIRRC